MVFLEPGSQNLEEVSWSRKEQGRAQIRTHEQLSPYEKEQMSQDWRESLEEK